MAQTRAIEQVLTNPLDHEGLCILSLDGGGVRGLSTLLIIKALMANVNAERRKDGKASVKPCELFDLIGGTSTGGIIAIMLGRLEMDVDDCIKAYMSMFELIFGKKGLPVSFMGKIKARFNSAVLEQCIENVLTERGFSKATLLNDGKDRCKVAVCATTFEANSTILLRSYASSAELNNLPVTICEAVRATSAASTFFNPVEIGPHGRKFVDGGMGANNPVEQLWNEAQRLWCQDERTELGEILKCFVSIGTGDPGSKPLNEGPLAFFKHTLVDIVTETQRTAKIFIERHRRLYEIKRYFRFNVQQGLQGIGLEEYKAKSLIDTSTTEYMDGQETRSAARDCAMNLKQRQFRLEFSPKRIVEWKSINRLADGGEQRCFPFQDYLMRKIIIGQKSITFIPFNRNENHVSRDSASEALDQLLTSPSGNQPVVMWGLGGCGKTQIALEFAYRRQKDISCSIFWVHADSEATFTRDYSELAKIAGLSPDLKGKDLLCAVQRWMEQQTSWLLILDNADDWRIFKRNHPARKDDQLRSPELSRFVPKSETGTVIWTSRDGGIVSSIITDVKREVKIGAMTMEESRKLFTQLWGQDDKEQSQHQENLLELLELLERLPLAIAQAAAYIRLTGVSVQCYLELFNESESQQSALLAQEFQDNYGWGVPKSVMQTWIISMKRISEENPGSAKILNTIAFFDNKGLPFDLLRAAAGPDFNKVEVLGSAGRLKEYSFLQVHKAVDGHLPTYEQHRLVQLATQQALSSTQTPSFSGDALRIISNFFPDGSHGTWSACKLLLPHAQKAVAWEAADDYDYRAPRLLQNIGMYYFEQGQSIEAEEVQVKVLKLLGEIRGKDQREKDRPPNPHMIKAMENLGRTWHQQGRFDEAEKLQVKVLQLREPLGEKHPQTIIAMSNLASTRQRQGKLADAEGMQRKILELQTDAIGEKDRDGMTISAMANLALTWSQQGKIVDAERLRSQVFELQKEGRGEKHTDTIRDMANLATSWKQQGHLVKAEKMEATVRKLQKEALGENHPDTITAMANLASTWNAQGRLDEAEALQLEVLELREKVLRKDHPDTIMAMANLAATYHEKNRLEEAEMLEAKVFEVRKEILGFKHPDTITALANFANTVGQQGRVAEAEEYEIEVLELQREVLGQKNPYTIAAMANLAITSLQQGRFDKAQQLQHGVAKLRKEVLGETHPHTIKAEADLATINRALASRPQRQRKVMFGVMSVKWLTVLPEYFFSIPRLPTSGVFLLILGMLHGLAFAVGPALAGAVFTWGLERGCLFTLWWTLGIIAAIDAMPVWWQVEMKGCSTSAENSYDSHDA